MTSVDAWLDIGAWIKVARANRAKTLVVVGLLVGMLALFGSWFTIDYYRTGEHDPVNDFMLTASVTHRSEGQYTVVPYDSRSCDCPTLGGTFNNAFLMVAGALLLGAATAVLSWRGLLKPEVRVAVAGLCGLLLIAAPLVLAASLPGAFAAESGSVTPASRENWENSFIGQNTSQQTLIVSWGPGLGWLASLAGGILVFLGVAMARGAFQRRPAAYNPAGALPAAVPGYAQPAPAPQSPPAPGQAPPSSGSFPSPTIGGDQRSSGGH